MRIDSRFHPALSAIILLSVCLLPLLALKDISPANELRYMSIAEEALENGNVFTFSNQGEPYADKPPLYLWLLMLARTVSGSYNTFVLALLSFIPAMVTIAVMDRWLVQVSRLSSIRLATEYRFAAAMMLGTSVMFLGAAVVMRMDMLMTMFIVLSLYTFYKMYRGIGSKAVNGLLLPLYIFLAMFTKGPVGLLMPVSAIFFFLLFSGRLREAGQYLGFRTWLVLLLLCLVWFAGVWHEGGLEYLENLLFHQTFGRAVDAFDHKRPFWYYFVAVWYVAAPYSIAAVYAMFSRAGRQGFVTDAGRLFYISTAVTFIMLTLFSSKLSVYLLPVMPFMIYYSVLAGNVTGCNGWMRFSFMVPSVILFLAGAAMISAPLSIRLVPDGILPEDLAGLSRRACVYLAGLVATAGSLLSVMALYRRKSWTMSASYLSATVAVAVLVLTPLVPQLNNYIGYRNLSAVAKELRKDTGVSGIATFGVSRSGNMDVLVGTDPVELDERISVPGGCRIDDTLLIVSRPALKEHAFIGDRLSGLYHVETGMFLVYVITDPVDL